ncbi:MULTISPECIES: hypothetical protein [Erysipelotrichaceae]|uniref:DUF4825 domain-containing protein n=1 Tax=Dubosiella newyorkensis TaxID=1862672 RepID=A0A1U7NMK8_9FIRM|nr:MULTISPECIES: hypothetical protein [Erysipelotrichaceae]OLU46463.1 hypothetical protein BO225_06015 [Dubosiella newyorkensis]
MKRTLRLLLLIGMSLSILGCSTTDEVSITSSKNETDYLVVEKPVDNIEDYFAFSKIMHTSMQPSNIVVNYGRLGNSTIVYTKTGDEFLYVEEDLIDSPSKQFEFANKLFDAEESIPYSEFTEQTGIE